MNQPAMTRARWDGRARGGAGSGPGPVVRRGAVRRIGDGRGAAVGLGPAGSGLRDARPGRGQHLADGVGPAAGGAGAGARGDAGRLAADGLAHRRRGGGPDGGLFGRPAGRPRLLAIGFAAWGLAVVATGLARSEVPIQAARAAAGAGGAAATVIALYLLADAFPRRMRGRVFAGFFLAMPVGAVLGRLLARCCSPVAGWQAAFLVAGAPGARAGDARPRSPRARPRGQRAGRRAPTPPPRAGRAQPGRLHRPHGQFVVQLFGLRHGVLVVRGGRAGLLVPGVLAAAGPGDPAGGGRLGGRSCWPRRSRGCSPAAGWPTPSPPGGPGGCSSSPASPCSPPSSASWRPTYGRSQGVIEGGLFLAEAAMFWPIVPVGFTVLAGVTMPNMRGVGFGVALAAVHVLGDLWSPTLLGWVIDTFAQPDSMATGFGRVLAAIGAVPVARPGHDPENLIAGLLAIIPALLDRRRRAPGRHSPPPPRVRPDDRQAPRRPNSSSLSRPTARRPSALPRRHNPYIRPRLRVACFCLRLHTSPERRTGCLRSPSPPVPPSRLILRRLPTEWKMTVETIVVRCFAGRIACDPE